MHSEMFVVEVGESRTTAVVYRAAETGPGVPPLVVLAHGAGAPQTHPWMVGAARALAARGSDVVTFNFLYAEAKRRFPDKNPTLEATWRAVIDAVRSRYIARDRLFIGGKSMGGRIATQVAADPTAPAELKGLVLFGYPLHPPGWPDKLRAAHLARVRAPMLFVQGSRDPFGTPEELEPFVTARAHDGTRIVSIEGGDHSLVPSRRRGIAGAGIEATIARVADEVAAFTASR